MKKVVLVFLLVLVPFCVAARSLSFGIEAGQTMDLVFDVQTNNDSSWYLTYGTSTGVIRYSSFGAGADYVLHTIMLDSSFVDISVGAFLGVRQNYYDENKLLTKLTGKISRFVELQGIGKFEALLRISVNALIGGNKASLESDASIGLLCCF